LAESGRREQPLQLSYPILLFEFCKVNTVDWQGEPNWLGWIVLFFVFQIAVVVLFILLLLAARLFDRFTTSYGGETGRVITDLPESKLAIWLKRHGVIYRDAS
jgi:hypothetical protein